SFDRSGRGGQKWADHPVCAAKVASQLFLIAQPPLLYEEGCTACLAVTLGDTPLSPAVNSFRPYSHSFTFSTGRPSTARFPFSTIGRWIRSGCLTIKETICSSVNSPLPKPSSR